MGVTTASASKPFFAVVPSASRVLSPKSSPPLSIVPLPFRSRQRKPSFFVQFIFSAKPFLSRSKFAPFSFVSTLYPSPSRSRIKGSYLVLLAVNTLAFVFLKQIPFTFSLTASQSPLKQS